MYEVAIIQSQNGNMTRFKVVFDNYLDADILATAMLKASADFIQVSIRDRIGKIYFSEDNLT